MKKIINKKPFLTIGYATYNRKKLIIRRLREILLMNLRKDIEVIIVDNASIDGTFSELKKIKSPKNISIYCNKTNLGFGGNVIEVIKKAKGEYVVWVSDEDCIEEKKINQIISYLKKKKPDSLILNHFKKISKKLFPTRLNKSRIINEKDVWGTCHLPGIIWRKKKLELICKNWKNYQKNYPQLSKYYPNLIFIINLIPNKNSFYYDNLLTYQKDFEKSQHEHILLYSYSNVIPRWLQHNEILKLIDDLIKNRSNIKHNIILNQMKENLNKNIYTYVLNAIYQENKEIYYHFVRSFYPSYILKRNFLFISTALRFFLNNPALSFQVILKRLRAFYNVK